MLTPQHFLTQRVTCWYDCLEQNGTHGKIEGKKVLTALPRAQTMEAQSNEIHRLLVPPLHCHHVHVREKKCQDGRNREE